LSDANMQAEKPAGNQRHLGGVEFVCPRLGKSPFAGRRFGGIATRSIVGRTTISADPRTSKKVTYPHGRGHLGGVESRTETLHESHTALKISTIYKVAALPIAAVLAFVRPADARRSELVAAGLPVWPASVGN